MQLDEINWFLERYDSWDPARPLSLRLFKYLLFCEVDIELSIDILIHTSKIDGQCL